MKKIDSLEFALDFEIKGTMLYLKLAKKTKNLLGKQLFYSLAAQEVDHARQVDEIYEQIQGNNKWNPVPSENLPPVEEGLKNFFLKAKSIDMKKDSKNTDGYELAMEMEKRGYKAYGDFCNSAGNESEKNFFKSLMEQEKEHLISLQNVYYYLTKTGDWLQEDESKVWSWMNT